MTRASGPPPLSSSRMRVQGRKLGAALARSKGTIIVFVSIWAFGLAALLIVNGLQTRADNDRRAQVVVETMTRQAGDLAVTAFDPDLATRGAAPTAAEAGAQLDADKRAIRASLVSLAPLSGRNQSATLDALDVRYLASIDQIVALVARGASRQAALDFGRDEQPGGSYGALRAGLSRSRARDNSDALRSRHVESIGTAVAFLLMLLAFSFTLWRATRLAHEKHRLLARSQIEAMTDALTGLPNRRKLFADMEALRREPAPEAVALGMFDLDGFKEYNDTFGHPAGDELLVRFGQSLAAQVGRDGSVYRMGGDEFCVTTRGANAERVLAAAAEALGEPGVGIEVTCSSGSVVIASHELVLERALRQADRLLYEDKRSSRARERRGTREPLPHVIAEDRLLLALSGHDAGRAGVHEPVRFARADQVPGDPTRSRLASTRPAR